MWKLMGPGFLICRGSSGVSFEVFFSGFKIVHIVLQVLFKGCSTWNGHKSRWVRMSEFVLSWRILFHSSVPHWFIRIWTHSNETIEFLYVCLWLGRVFVWSAQVREVLFFQWSSLILCSLGWWILVLGGRFFLFSSCRVKKSGVSSESELTERERLLCGLQQQSCFQIMLLPGESAGILETHFASVSACCYLAP